MGPTTGPDHAGASARRPRTDGTDYRRQLGNVKVCRARARWANRDSRRRGRRGERWSSSRPSSTPSLRAKHHPPSRLRHSRKRPPCGVRGEHPLWSLRSTRRNGDTSPGSPREADASWRTRRCHGPQPGTAVLPEPSAEVHSTLSQLACAREKEVTMHPCRRLCVAPRRISIRVARGGSSREDP